MCVQTYSTGGQRDGDPQEKREVISRVNSVPQRRQQKRQRRPEMWHTVIAHTIHAQGISNINNSVITREQEEVELQFVPLKPHPCLNVPVVNEGFEVGRCLFRDRNIFVLLELFNGRVIGVDGRVLWADGRVLGLNGCVIWGRWVCHWGRWAWYCGRRGSLEQTGMSLGQMGVILGQMGVIDAYPQKHLKKRYMQREGNDVSVSPQTHTLSHLWPVSHTHSYRVHLHI